MTRNYADMADGPTTFDPEEQFDRDIDARLKDRKPKSRQVSEGLDKAIQDELEHPPASIIKGEDDRDA